MFQPMSEWAQTSRLFVFLSSGVAVLYALIVPLAAAVMVGVWLTTRRSSVPDTSTPTVSEQASAVEAWAEAETLEVMVANQSSSPVHEVRAYVALGRRRRPTCVGWIRTLPPTGDAAARVALTADSRERWLRWRDGRSRGARDVAVEVTFRDHEGRRWRRDSSGALTASKS